MLGLVLILAQFRVLGKFFAISDIHFDIFYREDFNSTFQCHDRNTSVYKQVRFKTNDVQPVVRPNCDSSAMLVKRTIEKMKEIEPDPDFILILGDHLGHYTSTMLDEENNLDFDYNKRFIYESYKFIYSKLALTFPNTQVVPLIGNNDAFKNFHLPGGQAKAEFLQFLYDLWTPFVGGIDPVFLRHGFYNTTTKTGQHLVVLNSNLFSVWLSQEDAGQEEELNWVEDQLMRNKNIFILMHVPPGFSLFEGGTQQWHDLYAQQFCDLISRYKENISAVFASHYHNGGFQVLDAVPLLLHPSISPSVGGNPRIRLYDWENKDYTDYTLDAYSYTGKWVKRSVTEEFGSSNTHELYSLIKAGEISIRKYTEWITGWWIYYKPHFLSMCGSVYGKVCNSSESYLKLVTECHMTYYLSAQFIECVSKSKLAQASLGNI